MSKTKNEEIATVKLKKSNEPRNGARYVEKLSRLTVRIPTELLKAMKLYAGALNCTVQKLAANAFVVGFNLSFQRWEEGIRKNNPQLADEILENLGLTKKELQSITKAAREGTLMPE